MVNPSGESEPLDDTQDPATQASPLPNLKKHWSGQIRLGSEHGMKVTGR